MKKWLHFFLIDVMYNGFCIFDKSLRSKEITNLSRNIREFQIPSMIPGSILQPARITLSRMQWPGSRDCKSKSYGTRSKNALLIALKDCFTLQNESGLYYTLVHRLPSCRPLDACDSKLDVLESLAYPGLSVCSLQTLLLLLLLLRNVISLCLQKGHSK